MPSIIIYFSRAGENYVGGSIQRLETGNTEIAARLLQQETQGEIFRLEPKTPYSDLYRECVAQAREEMQRDARPALAAYPQSMEKFDTVYLAYPNYCGTMPMPVFTFLDHYDFTGKTICPLCTHEGSGMGHSEEDIRRLCPGATVKAGLAVRGAQAAQAGPAIHAWITSLR